MKRKRLLTSGDWVMIKAFVSIFVAAVLIKFCAHVAEGLIYVGGGV